MFFWVNNMSLKYPSNINSASKSKCNKAKRTAKLSKHSVSTCKHLAVDNPVPGKDRKKKKK